MHNANNNEVCVCVWQQGWSILKVKSFLLSHFLFVLLITRKKFLLFAHLNTLECLYKTLEFNSSNLCVRIRQVIECFFECN